MSARDAMAGEGRPGAAPVVIEAKRVAAGKPMVAGDFTFTVMVDKPSSDDATAGDRRRAPRQRTRLRSGKIVDPGGRFLTECLWHDLSPRGGRLRVPPGVTLPHAIQIYDDQTGALHQASVLWRSEREAGVAFRPAATDARSRALAADMRRKFYAVRD